jgi:hypothetical protein
VFVAKTCPALSQKIIRFRCRANQFYQLAPSFPGKRGGSRVVTNAGGDAVDAAASARKGNRRAGYPVSEQPARKTNDAFCVRQNRVVLASVADVKLTEAKSAQPGADLAVNPFGDGDKKEFVAGESTA